MDIQNTRYAFVCYITIMKTHGMSVHIHYQYDLILTMRYVTYHMVHTTVVSPNNLNMYDKIICQIMIRFIVVFILFARYSSW